MTAMTQLSADTRPLAAGPAPTGIAAVFAHPRTIALVCMAVLTIGGWAYLLSSAVWLAPLEPVAFLEALCRPVAPGSGDGFVTVAIIGAMWLAMTLAMMLPTAGPMILTYADIAETARREQKPIVSPHLLIAGYLTVWFGFAVVATLLQLVLMQVAAWPPMARLAVPASAELFLIAGLYQFSSLKQACLKACQQPFSLFFMNWSDRPAGVFKLGVRQGLYCLGCCWAMMLLMFVAGAMNAVWMALLGLVMLVEKMNVLPHVTRAVGIAFIAVGLTMLALWAWDHGLININV
jgi:predicted metal-binding membrane protein